ncbi:MAG TPA: potassium transporter TrkA [Bacillota bacterium]
MKRKKTLKNRLNYWFDNILSKGSAALISWLAVLSLILILGVSAVANYTRAALDQNGKPLSFLQVVWMSLMRAMDSGTIAGDSGGFLFMALMLLVTLGGIFIVSTLIGILNTGIEQKLDNLRKGKSFVVEHGHTIILGWSSHVTAIISELVVANSNKRHSCIVILADRDKVEMEDEIRSKLGSTGRTRIVCRSGNPMRLNDLAMVNPNDSKTILVLAPDEGDPDIQVIKTILAITNNPDRRRAPYHIVAEVHDPKNLQVAKMVGRDEVELLLAGDLIARIAVQTCCQSGLSIVYTELLDFGGDEIYFNHEKKLLGKTFGEAMLAYEDSAIIGIRFRDGRVQLKPPLDTQIQTGDQLIAISEDDDTIRLSNRKDYKINEAAIQKSEREERQPERTLVLGWNPWGMTIVNELDNYMPPGSAVTVVANLPETWEEVSRAINDRNQDWKNQKVKFLPGDTVDRRTLDDLAINTYQHIIVLSYSGTLDAEAADAQTLVTLLHLRDIAEKSHAVFSITSEMLDAKNRELAEIAHADDFIVSDRLISLMMSQVAENKQLMPVFADLFDPEGAELYLKPAVNYVKPGVPVNFYTVTEAARRQNEIAIGYRLDHQAKDATRAYGVRVNVNKSEMVTFTEKDKVIVLAED